MHPNAFTSDGNTPIVFGDSGLGGINDESWGLDNVRLVKVADNSQIFADMLKSVLPAGRKAMFWRNDGQNVTTQPNDILHYWGSQADVASSNFHFI
ncbi:MAG: hypothetical protein ACKO96_05995 [Flammeovirgaceae bacterium]